jgi:hypothetical protein
VVESRPAGDARIVAHSYTYVVPDEWIEDRIDIDGVELPRRWTIKFSLADLPDPATRQRARALRQLYEEIGIEPELDEPTEDPVEFLEQLERWLGVEQERLSYEQHQREQAELDRELEIQEFESEMNDWIEKEGSNRLKVARSKGYKVSSSYARERGMEDLPGFWVDTAGLASYRERVDPSFEALELENALEERLSRVELPLRTRVVWLVEPPSGLAEALEKAGEDEIFAPDFEQQEAVLVARYLGRYDAFLLVDREHRAPSGPDDREV